MKRSASLHTTNRGSKEFKEPSAIISADTLGEQRGPAALHSRTVLGRAAGVDSRGRRSAARNLRAYGISLLQKFGQGGLISPAAGANYTLGRRSSKWIGRSGSVIHSYARANDPAGQANIRDHFCCPRRDCLDWPDHRRYRNDVQESGVGPKIMRHAQPRFKKLLLPPRARRSARRLLRGSYCSTRNWSA